MEQIGERDNLDTFDARAYQGGVRGLYTIAEGMVMFGREARYGLFTSMMVKFVISQMYLNGRILSQNF